jgi:hypothetical protein
MLQMMTFPVPGLFLACLRPGIGRIGRFGACALVFHPLDAQAVGLELVQEWF